jgi:tetratricopeptide (TPR) repeat protein
MKNIFLIAAGITMLSLTATAQPGKKPNAQDPAAQAKLNEEMEKAMKNMTPEQREQMKKMMPGIMPSMLENANEYRYPEITNNKELLYKKDMARINAIPKKKLTQADIPAYVNNLFSKIMAKGDATEIAIIKNVMTKGKDAAHLGNAAILCMLQGHSQAAMGLSIKALQTDPTNANCQNNMASLLTQYGYAEQAIPVLQKLRTEFNDNSTVLNNLAQAWFSLGAVDSAKYFAAAAIKSNPLNPDALVCGGVIDEAEGNTESATEKYIQAMAQSPDGFTESVLKNSAGQNGINDIDFDKLIENITIYNYFPKDWIQIPELSNSVSGFENDIAIKNGYAKMFIDFNKDLQFKIDQSQAEIQNSLKQGKEGFAFDVMTAGMKQGNSFITTPARIIVSLIIIKLNKLSQDYAEVKKDMTKNMELKVKEKINAGKNDNCEVIDNRNNKFLEEINRLNRVDFTFWIEQYRIWLNALCTWTWYNTGNIKNFSMVQCLNFTKFYAGLFRDAIAMQQTAFQCGKEGIRSDGEIKPPTPLIPLFKCPTVVSVPAGQDWHALDNKLKNFDANSLGIKKLGGAPVPNVNISYGALSKKIAQSSNAASVKVSNGSILPDYGGAPLPEYKSPVSNEEVNKVIDKNFQRLLKKQMQKEAFIDCDGFKKMKDANEDERIAEDIRKHNEKLIDEMETERLQDELKELFEKSNPYSRDEMEELAPIISKKSIDNKSIKITPTLSSSVQAPGTFTPQPGLFK